MKKIEKTVIAVVSLALFVLLMVHRFNHAELNNIQYFIAYWQYCLIGGGGAFVFGYLFYSSNNGE